MKFLGLDIGGANIKLSDADGHTRSLPFPMWVRKNELCETLVSLVAEDESADLVALTMTAELADCFATKEEGVSFVISAVEQAFPGVPLRVWLTSGEFAEPDDARYLPELVAAANWSALATWAARAVPDGPGLLIDIGSTTSDLIPLLDGMPVSEGRTDLTRLQSGELVYTGAGRTPVCAVVPAVPFRGGDCSIAAELFATMADVLVVTGHLPEDELRTDTADGRTLTRSHSLSRLARMLCCDLTEVSESELVSIAKFIADQQQLQLRTALTQVLEQLELRMQSADGRSLQVEKPTVLLSGSGSFVAERLVKEHRIDRFHEILSLSQMFSRPVADAACAFAVARLAHDVCRDDLLETSVF